MKTLDPVVHRIKKETILQHARHLFATKGFAETSVDDIAQVCHLQKASLYHYFEGKQQILQEMVDLECARRSARLRELKAETNLEKMLTQIARAFLGDFEDPGSREFFTIVYFESHKNPAILKALKESPAQDRKGFYAIFEKHLRGKLSSRKISIYVTQFMGALIHFATLAKLRGENSCFEPCTDGEYTQQLVSRFILGLE